MRKRSVGTKIVNCPTDARVRKNAEWHFIYHPSCERKPAVYTTESDDTYTPPPGLVTSSRRLRKLQVMIDEKPRWKRFGDCYNLKQSATGMFPPGIILERKHAESFEYPFSGCGPMDFVHEIRYANTNIELRMPSLDRSHELVTGLPRSTDAVNALELFRAYGRQRALSAFLPDLEDGFSVLVMIAEFKDLPRMVRSCLHLLDRSNRRKLLAALRGRPIRSVSQSWLAANFGWLPFVSSVMELVSRLKDVGDKATRLLEDAGKRRTLHYGMQINPELWGGSLYEEIEQQFDPLSFAPNQWLDPVIRNLRLTERVSTRFADVKYHATCDHHYTLPWGGFWGSMFASLDRFGINLSISDIWELIPFSFVIDWLFNVQNKLAVHDLMNNKPTIVISDFCDSVKYTYTRTSDFTRITWIETPNGWENPTLWTVTPDTSSSSFTEKLYHRKRARPVFVDEAGAVTFRTPSGYTISLALALAVNTRR